MSQSDDQRNRPTTRNSSRHFRHFGSQGILSHTVDTTTPSTTILRRSARLNPHAPLEPFQANTTNNNMLNHPERNPQPPPHPPPPQNNVTGTTTVRQSPIAHNNHNQQHNKQQQRPESTPTTATHSNVNDQHLPTSNQSTFNDPNLPSPNSNALCHFPTYSQWNQPTNTNEPLIQHDIKNNTI